VDLASKLIKELQELGATEIFHPDQVSATESSVYVVINGSHILHVGQGSSKRLLSLLPTSTGSGHQSALVVMLSYALHGENFRYFFLPTKSPEEAYSIEWSLHARFGETALSGRKFEKRAAERVLVNEYIKRFCLGETHEIRKVLEAHCKGHLNAATAIHNDYWLRYMYSLRSETYFRWKWLFKYRRTG
jgi:hypothetical protein